MTEAIERHDLHDCGLAARAVPEIRVQCLLDLGAMRDDRLAQFLSVARRWGSEGVPSRRMAARWRPRIWESGVESALVSNGIIAFMVPQS
ncbi:hypothetical protein [Bradyrhizobium canariense]|uniref:hypothetical protein n=1 Tax=Bradyrhizobium canariense TaxID=255045 RepID=UPI0012FD26E3|nr:hypothetical protein [Bradyrhizobium canariense]